ncbi:hypothetical protein FACS1894204_04600 [Synergistales bacterium]|nr:hypothetical protein FACS1894204_04600 [Synergistales bacterium]
MKMKIYRIGAARRAFSLAEVICAIIILTIAVLASLATIGYALAITSDNQVRMKTYQQLERLALESVARNEVVSPDWVEGSGSSVSLLPIPAPGGTSPAVGQSIPIIQSTAGITIPAITLWRVPYKDDKSRNRNIFHRIYMSSPTVVVVLPGN